jgi:hypothetical protein
LPHVNETAYWTLSADGKVLTRAVHTVSDAFKAPPVDDLWVFDEQR